MRGFSTAARGSDIIFLEELIKRKGDPVVIMPFPEEDFRRISVGGDWDHRLDKIHDKIKLRIIERTCPPEEKLPDAFHECSRKVMQYTIDYAKRLDTKPILLVVWDRKSGRRGGTADTINVWSEEGYNKPDIIDITTL